MAGSGLTQILFETQYRWLRPTEICEILRNYQKFNLNPDPPHKPPGGSWFLFDRKALRYFRKDGHSWRKKKDGKSVREAHEKLKAGNVDVLHCYYAHGEDNENFHRRSYWMLDGQLEHIVFVHYREVKEGSRCGIPHADLGLQSGSPQTSSLPGSTQDYPPPLVVQLSYAPPSCTAEWIGRTPSVEFENVDYMRTASLFESICSSESQDSCLRKSDPKGFLEISRDQLGSGFATAGISADVNTTRLSDAKFEASGIEIDLGVGDRLFPDADSHTLEKGSLGLIQEQGKDEKVRHVNLCPYDKRIIGDSNNVFNVKQEHDLSLLHLKKLDSFGRWMDREIGGDCDDVLIASDSSHFWNALDTQSNDTEVSSLTCHMQLEIGSPGPSLSQEQLFSICDFSPDWAYSGVETKVLISGTYLGDVKHLSSTKWCCMFGEVEVPAEVLTNNVLRCHAPVHAPGSIPFYITCSNRLACSEVREFQYRENLSGVTPSLAVKGEPEDEMRLQIRLAKMLFQGLNANRLYCSVENCEECNIRNSIYFMRSEEENFWEDIEKTYMAFKGNYGQFKDVLFKKLLKDRLYVCLFLKVHEGSKGPHFLDDEGQGIIHLAAALGYEWAIGPIVAAGVSPSFRDLRGRTGLHWAAYYGREETVVALIKLGAVPGAVEDPTPSFPGGRTAADLASSRGHKGIAGYLAREDLTSRLASLMVDESVMRSVTTTVAADKAVKTAEEQSFVSPNGSKEEQLLLREAIAAVEHSAIAARLIQAAFSAHSFRHRELTGSSSRNSELSSDLFSLASSKKAQNMSHFSDYLHREALRIQMKYRGWKERKEFLKKRDYAVKIQAHVRGYQVRKQYKKVIWSVSIVEKAILRWRRKRAGLRGFQAEKTIGNVEPDLGKIDEYEFLHLGQRQKVAGVENALARVQSMVRYREACDQYMRLVAKTHNSKMGPEGSNGLFQVQSLEESKTNEALFPCIHD